MPNQVVQSGLHLMWLWHSGRVAKQHLTVEARWLAAEGKIVNTQGCKTLWQNKNNGASSGTCLLWRFHKLVKYFRCRRILESLKFIRDKLENK